MTATAVLNGSTRRSRPGSPDAVARDLVLSVVDSILGRDPTALADQLLTYYAPGRDECGTTFLDGTEAESPYTVTAADLFAVTMLRIPVSSSIARRLLYDTLESARVAACLVRLHMSLDATLAEARLPLLHAMAELHDAVVAAVDPRPQPEPASHLLASAICARKRPELFPVLDHPFRTALALPDAGAPASSWLVLRSVLRRPHVRQGLAAAFGAARTRDRDVPIDVYPLRQLYVLACHIGGQSRMPV